MGCLSLFSGKVEGRAAFRLSVALVESDLSVLVPRGARVNVYETAIRDAWILTRRL